MAAPLSTHDFLCAAAGPAGSCGGRGLEGAGDRERHLAVSRPPGCSEAAAGRVGRGERREAAASVLGRSVTGHQQTKHVQCPVSQQRQKMCWDFPSHGSGVIFSDMSIPVC